MIARASLGSTAAFTYTITDDDPQPAVAFTAPTGSGPENLNAPSVPVSLSAVALQLFSLWPSWSGCLP